MPKVLVEIILPVEVSDVNLQPWFQSELLDAMYIVVYRVIDYYDFVIQAIPITSSLAIKVQSFGKNLI